MPGEPRGQHVKHSEDGVLSEHWHLGDLRRLLKCLFGEQTHIANTKCTASAFKEKKVANPTTVANLLIFTTKKKKPNIFAVTSNAHIRCIFINNYSSSCCCLASKPVYSLSELSVTDGQLPADRKPSLAPQPQKVILTPNFDIHSVILQGHGLGLSHPYPKHSV